MFDQNQPEEQLRYVDTKNTKRGTNTETEKEMKDTKGYRKTKMGNGKNRLYIYSDSNQ
jgi:hypothetical protein